MAKVTNQWAGNCTILHLCDYVPLFFRCLIYEMIQRLTFVSYFIHKQSLNWFLRWLIITQYLPWYICFDKLPLLSTPTMSGCFLQVFSHGRMWTNEFGLGEFLKSNLNSRLTSFYQSFPLYLTALFSKWNSGVIRWRKWGFLVMFLVLYLGQVMTPEQVQFAEDHYI